MANWYGVARTNYVTVIAGKLDALKAAVEPFNLEVHTKGDMVCFTSKTENGEWPSTMYDYNSNEFVEFEIGHHILPYITDDSVLILMETGSEKMRYMTGVAMAYKKGHRRIKISIDDIYKRAEKAFNKDGKTNITQCAY